MYRQPKRKTWQVDVGDDLGHVRKGCSTGTPDKVVARDVVRMLDRFRTRRQWEPLRAIAQKQLTLQQVYDADVRGRLDALLATVAAVDLAPLVAEWAAAKGSTRYVPEVRRFIPAGVPFPATEFRRSRISAWLATLVKQKPTPKAFGGPTDSAVAASPATKNRYKAALSVFAMWLIEREILETNPTREVAARAEPAPRMVHFTGPQAQAFLRACPPGELALVVALLANGIEWGAIANATRRDLRLDAETPSRRRMPTLDCFPARRPESGKTVYRSRLVELTESWTWPALAHAAALPDHARLTTLDLKKVEQLHTRLCTALRIPEPGVVHRPHDWRHTYAITALDRRDDPRRIRNNLGHAPQSPLIFTRYGVKHYVPAPTRPAPPPDTPQTTKRARGLSAAPPAASR